MGGAGARARARARAKSGGAGARTRAKSGGAGAGARECICTQYLVAECLRRVVHYDGPGQVPA